MDGYYNLLAKPLRTYSQGRFYAEEKRGRMYESDLGLHQMNVEKNGAKIDRRAFAKSD